MFIVGSFLLLAGRPKIRLQCVCILNHSVFKAGLSLDSPLPRSAGTIAKNRATNAGYHGQYPADQDKVEQHARTGVAERVWINGSSPLGPEFIALYGVLGPEMAFAIKVRHIVVEPSREAPRSRTGDILRGTGVGLLVRRPRRILGALLALLAPSSVAVERRRRALELRASPAETRGRAAAHRRAAAVVGSRGVLLGRGAQEVPVIAGALFRAPEHGVGFGDLDESLRGLGVVWVAVGVVRLAQLVELPE